MHTTENYIQSHDISSLLPKLYGDAYDETYSLARFNAIVHTHKKLFGPIDTKKIGIYSTAGRTELAGNHTDHNLGKVIAGSINLDTIAAAHITDDMIITIISEGFPPVEVDISDLTIHPEERGTTDALVRGIAAGFVQKGLGVGGFKANTSTSVLKGSGLSSSAAIEMMVCTLCNNLYNQDLLSAIDMALISQYAENVYFGKPSGLMDQIACGHGGVVLIDFAKPKEPLVTPVSCNFRELGYDLVVVDTGGNHANLTHEYASIVEEMRLVSAYYGQEHLRGISLDQYIEDLSTIRSHLSQDRALIRTFHFLTENNRVDAMLTALQQKDIDSYLALVRESGRSSFCYLQNLFSAQSYSEQGLPLAISLTEQFLGKMGACRVHGGGFAGTIQVYVPIEYTKKYCSYIEKTFNKGSATVLAIRELPTSKIG